MAVEFISSPEVTEDLIANNSVDLVAVGREALFDPQWPLHAQRTLGGDRLDYRLWRFKLGTGYATARKAAKFEPFTAHLETLAARTTK